MSIVTVQSSQIVVMPIVVGTSSASSPVTFQHAMPHDQRKLREPQFEHDSTQVGQPSFWQTPDVTSTDVLPASSTESCDTFALMFGAFVTKVR